MGVPRLRDDLFGALLLVYLSARLAYGETFSEASKHLSLPLGTANTAILIASSFTMALAHSFVVAERWRGAVVSLALTGALGFVFLAIKAAEYAKEYHEGLAPVLGAPFRYDGSDPIHVEMFFILYFVLTSLHAAHLQCGIRRSCALARHGGSEPP